MMIIISHELQGFLDWPRVPHPNVVLFDVRVGEWGEEAGAGGSRQEKPLRHPPPNSQAAFQDSFHIPTAVKNGNDLQGLCLGTIDNQVRVNRKESYILIRQVPAAVAGPRRLRQKRNPVTNDGLYVVGQRKVGF